MKKILFAVFLFGILYAAYGQTYYTGTGGRGLTITVGRPDGKNLPANEQYLLDLVQGTLTGDFQKYTAMTVTDRQNLDKILEEQKLSESGSFSQENYARIGRLTNAKYLLTGSITKAQNNYFLELAISDAETGERGNGAVPGAYGTEERYGGGSVVVLLSGSKLRPILDRSGESLERAFREHFKR